MTACPLTISRPCCAGLLIVFARFDVLGLRFIPRLRDAGDRLLHLLGPPTVDRGRASGRPQTNFRHVC